MCLPNLLMMTRLWLLALASPESVRSEAWAMEMASASVSSEVSAMQRASASLGSVFCLVEI